MEHRTRRCFMLTVWYALFKILCSWKIVNLSVTKLACAQPSICDGFSFFTKIVYDLFLVKPVYISYKSTAVTYYTAWVMAIWHFFNAWASQQPQIHTSAARVPDANKQILCQIKISELLVLSDNRCFVPEASRLFWLTTRGQGEEWEVLLPWPLAVSLRTRSDRCELVHMYSSAQDGQPDRPQFWLARHLCLLHAGGDNRHQII